ncbi:MAG: hypothetical protein IKF90_21970 [Parasporobacterium sp.]|nr:hypothetical protein [Parasporobacterium sp.]
MDRKESRYYLNLPYPENLIRTVCVDDEEITEDRITGLQYSLESMTDRELDVLDYRFRERKTFREIADLFGIPAERVRVIYDRTLRKLRKTYRFPMIALGYDASRQAKERAVEAERREDEEAFEEAVENTGNLRVLDMSVRDLDLSVRVINRLEGNGIESVRDLWIISQRHPKEYLRIRSLGEIGRKEIDERLQHLGFILKGGTENG